MSSLSTGYISHTFAGLIDRADKKVSSFIEENTGTTTNDGKFVKDADGTLTLSASASLELQQLMADQSISAQVSTSTLKSVKDSISSAARNI